MITNFSDHAANERAFLAWVRTSIAVIAFGFIVERFDLFLAFASLAAGKARLPVARSGFGHIAGLVLIILGMGMIAIAAVRFVRMSPTCSPSGKARSCCWRVEFAWKKHLRRDVRAQKSLSETSIPPTLVRRTG